MRLGSRWDVGTPPHPSVPASLHGEIAVQEARYAAADSWTLTWLEGRPRCALDDLVIVTLSPEGDVRVLELSVGEGKLSAQGASADTAADEVSRIAAFESGIDDEDDDWLS